MKRISTFIYLTIIVLINSCEKESFIRFGFDSPIDKNSEGLVIADISSNVKQIYLNGLITLCEGEAAVYLFDPNGDTIYSKIILAPFELNIDETFEAKPGYWKLKHKSNEGVGEIDLHIQNK
ncbi:MAG: hypothetical protein JG775_2739 [Defluviitaleaceae bacterium]|jgi:hypothetical protein|nr:hypothetical protein [Defluviitaleaceae bacterium]MDK2904914.1 hypothetical protein [Eubacteriaceae bacterium]